VIIDDRCDRSWSTERGEELACTKISIRREEMTRGCKVQNSNMGFGAWYEPTF
jgi:hypothetical protein